MMFTTTPPNASTDRTRLFPSLSAVRTEIAQGRTVFEVAVAYDARNRRVVPHGRFKLDPCFVWTTPGQAHADESVTARGPIPAQLYVGPTGLPDSCGA